MPNILLITLVLIAVTALIGAFAKGRGKDLCLVDFKGSSVTVEMKDGQVIWGRLSVEPTGLELLYDTDHLDEKDGNIECSYILYKNEFPDTEVILRYHDTLSAQEKEKREKALKRYYHPRAMYRMKRKIRNFFYTVKDAVVEIVALFVGRVKSSAAVGTALTGQDKYLTQLQQKIIPPVSVLFEPLLEKYIGKKVIFKMARGDRQVEYSGILKDYTSEFIEILDIEYRKEASDIPRTADIIFSRAFGVVRHLGK